MAPTIAYDSEVMGDISMGSTIPTDLLGAVTVPPSSCAAGPRRGGHAHHCAPCLEGPGRAGSIGAAMKMVEGGRKQEPGSPIYKLPMTAGRAHEELAGMR